MSITTKYDCSCGCSIKDVRAPVVWLRRLGSRIPRPLIDEEHRQLETISSIITENLSSLLLYVVSILEFLSEDT